MSKKDVKRAGKAPAQMTVAELIDNMGVPVAVRFWLEEYAARGKAALDTYDANTNEATLELARFVFDVLQSKYEETGTGARERVFSEEARDFVEEFLYRLADHAGVQVWNYARVAVAALPVLIDCTDAASGMSSTLTLLRAGVERLSTRQQLREFLKHDADRYGVNDEDERDNEAAYKLSRVLADPRTPTETRREIEDALNKFSMSSRVTVYHPAVARRAFQLMCEARPKGNVRECRRDRTALLALRDSISDGEGGGDE